MNNIFKTTIFGIVLAFGMSSCSDWLDVKPENEERETDMFTSYQGFQDALSGCYSAMADRNLYGEKLTISDIDELACLWIEPNETDKPEWYYMYHHIYNNSTSEDVIDDIYGGLYNVVSQANIILEHIDSEGSNIASTDSRNCIQGEALAIRAFCQFDVLRLFGQVPQNSPKTVKLPYATKTSITDHASYYDYATFVSMLETDLNKAEELLGKSDPVLKYTYSQLNGLGNDPAELDDEFLMYRKYRLNYYAVKALKARFYLYTGQTAKAYTEAMAIINAKLNGENYFTLGASTPTSEGYTYNVSSEAIFGLSNAELIDYSIDIMGTGTQVYPSTDLCVSSDMFTKQLWAGDYTYTASDIRYLSEWNQQASTSTGKKYPTNQKYYWDTSKYNSSSTLSTLMMTLEVMPLIRLSEIYLIAMETSTDLSEINQLYKDYMESKNVLVTSDFASMDEVKTMLLTEYRREFYGEGVMFYTYKRLGSTKDMMFNTDGMTLDKYILPLPTSEGNTNASN